MMLEMFLKCPKINIHLTPANLKLLLDVIEIMKTTTVEVRDSIGAGNVPEMLQNKYTLYTCQASNQWHNEMNRITL